MSNSIYEKVLYSVRKNQTVTKLVTSETRFDKLSGDTLLKTCYSVAKDVVIMRFNV